MFSLAALVTPGQFKAKKKDPERMLGDFNDYIKSVKDMRAPLQQRRRQY